MIQKARLITAALLDRSEQTAPPISVHAVAADMDVTIERVWLPLSQPGFTALIRSRWFIWVNAAHGPRRRRFTTGHELGHVAMGHQGVVFFFDCGEPRHLRVSANRFAGKPPDTALGRRVLEADSRAL